MNASVKIVMLSSRVNRVIRISWTITKISLLGALFFAFACSGGEKKSCKIDTLNPLPDKSEQYRPILDTFQDSPPGRIISVSPSITELLFEFGVGDKIIGATNPHDYPSEAQNIETVGNVSIDLEKIILLKPDIVIGEANLFAGMNLTDLGIPVLLFDTRSVDDLIFNIGVLENLFRHNRAESMINSIQTTLSNVEIPPKSPNIAIMISNIPLMLAGGDSYFSDLVSLAGGRSVISDIHGDYLTISQEDLITFNPEIIICTFENIKTDILRDKRYSTVDAVINKRVYQVDPDIVLRPTLRSVTVGIPYLNEIIRYNTKNHPAEERGD